MRAFLAACAAALVIAVCGAVVLDAVNKPSKRRSRRRAPGFKLSRRILTREAESRV